MPGLAAKLARALRELQHEGRFGLAPMAPDSFTELAEELESRVHLEAADVSVKDLQDMLLAVSGVLRFFEANILNHKSFSDSTVVLWQEVRLGEDLGGGTIRVELTLGDLRRLELAKNWLALVTPIASGPEERQ